MKSLAIIPARGGSRRIPRKNVRLFHGKPIIAYSIETARACGLFDRILVSTEDQDIAAVAKAYGAKVSQRPMAMARDSVGTQEVARDALQRYIASAHGTPPEYACCIYATAPLMTAEDLRAGLDMLQHGTKPYVYTVGPDGQHAGQWYWGRVKSFVDGVPLEGNSATLTLPAERVCDINVEDDFQRAERLYAALHQQRCRSPSGRCDQSTCVIEGACQWPAPCQHDHRLVPTTDPRIPELAHFACTKCGHILPT